MAVREGIEPPLHRFGGERATVTLTDCENGGDRRVCTVIVLLHHS